MQDGHQFYSVCLTISWTPRHNNDGDDDGDDGDDDGDDGNDDDDDDDDIACMHLFITVNNASKSFLLQFQRQKKIF